MKNKEPKTAVSPHDKAAGVFYSFLSTLLICMVCIFCFFMFFGRIVSVSGKSMQPNLTNADKLFVSDFLYKAKYGDIIAVGRSSEDEKAIIKRVMALPGDTVDINFDTHLITVNGEVIIETYFVNGAIKRKGDVSFPLTVPEDCVFVLGDNRNESLDSRFSSVGFISEDEILGKAYLRLLPAGKRNIYQNR